MYCEKGKQLSEEVVKNALLKMAKELKVKIEYTDHIDLAVRDIVNLNDALLNAPRGVYAILEKEPRGNLDTGGHHYSIYYTKDNEPQRFWSYEFMKLWGCKRNATNRSLPYWTFFSTAIGMSRLLDATGGLFAFMRSLGGCYCQIDCL